MEVGSMGGRLFTDKLVFRWSGLLVVWSLDSATPATSAYPAHASGSSPPQLLLLNPPTLVARQGIKFLVPSSVEFRP